MTRLDLGVFFDRTPSALVVLDRELRYVAANAAYLSKTGSTLDEIVGRSVFADVERDRVELVRASLERVLSTRKPDGASTVRYVPLLDAAGDVELIVQESQDVRGEPVAFARTDLDGAEAELRFIIESIPVQVWTATPDGQLDYVSDRVVTYFQTTAAEILGNGWLSVLHPDDAETCVKRWTHSLTTGEPYEVEFRLRRGDGEYRWHLGRAAAHRGPDGAVLRWFGTNTDVHDAKLAVAELRVRSEYEQRLIGIVSHDLRNPLNAIALGVSLLATSDLDDHAAKTLARVTRSADRATRLITDLLDFAKARIGTTIPINPRPTNLREIVEHVADEFQVTSPSRLIRIGHAGDEDGRWDADRIAQVISNLLGNALQHGPAETPIRIESKIDGDDAVFAVINGGPPIPSAELSLLFEPYKQGGNARSAGGSLGLGLYIAREVVVAHGGTIEVASDVVETRFTVRLPRFATTVA